MLVEIVLRGTHFGPQKHSWVPRGYLGRVTKLRRSSGIVKLQHTWYLDRERERSQWCWGRWIYSKGKESSMIVRYGENAEGLTWKPFELRDIGEAWCKDKRKVKTQNSEVPRNIYTIDMERSLTVRSHGRLYFWSSTIGRIGMCWCTNFRRSKFWSEN